MDLESGQTISRHKILCGTDGPDFAAASRTICPRLVELGLLLTVATVLPGCGGSEEAGGPERAEPHEVIAKVRKAAALLAEEREAAVRVLRDNRSEFTWKDTYVFVVNCSADEVVANPAFPERQGGDIKQHTDYNGKQYGLELCEMAQRPGVSEAFKNLYMGAHS